jgi:cell wall-associated NlpC family hydrolase
VEIAIDLGALDGLGVSCERAMQDLSGILADIRRRVLATDFDLLVGYGIDPGACVADVERGCSRLTDDVIRLEQAAADLSRSIQLAAQDQPGGLGPYATAVPDVWWFRARADAGAPAPADPGSAGGVPLPGDLSQRIVNSAEQWVGVPYLWGGGHGAVVNPAAVNVDCSGLVHQVFGENGISIGGGATAMYSMGTGVPDLAHAMPGDLLFWGTSTYQHHVAIYIGDGKMIEAPHTGAWVHVTNVYGGDFVGIRRILPPA